MPCQNTISATSSNISRQTLSLPPLSPSSSLWDYSSRSSCTNGAENSWLSWPLVATVSRCSPHTHDRMTLTIFALAYALGLGLRFGLNIDPQNMNVYIAYYMFVVLSVGHPLSLIATGINGAPSPVHSLLQIIFYSVALPLCCKWKNTF